MKRKGLRRDPCPVARSLEVVGDVWSLLVVREALAGRRRFGEFQTSLGVARNILADRLKKLVERGVLATAPASDGSPYREYVLTESGRGLYVVLLALRQWGEGCLFRDGERELVLVDRANQRPVRPLELRADDGRLLGPEDVEFLFVATPAKGRKSRAADARVVS